MPSEGENGVTRLLQRAREGDRNSADDLFLLVHDELHRMARGQMGRQDPGHTLQATALVNEAYVRVFRLEWRDREHFLAVAARAMRSILVDHARRKERAKRSPPGERLPLDDLIGALQERAGDLAGLDAALERLASYDPELVRLVELRFFAGLGMGEVAGALGVSLRTAQRLWRIARARLREEMR